MLVIAYPDLIEFFRVVGVYGQEFDPFIKGKGFVHGLLQYPEVKREPAYIPVEVFVFSHLMRIELQM
jgi:hypothetical protein